MTSPCKNCQNRELGCHAKCEAYIKFRQKRDVYIEKRWEEREKLDIYLAGRKGR